MNRFITTAISLVLIVAILPLAAISQGGSGFKPVYAAPISISEPETPSVDAQSNTSPYDGKYSGTFNYEYRENRLEKMPGREYSEFVEGEWKTGSFTLTVTLKDLAGSDGVEIFALVTSVYCGDPNFGTGPSAITPAPNSGAILPADPPTTPMNPSGPRMGIHIFFPNGAELYTVTPSTASRESGDLSVSLTGQTLSGSTWMGVTPSGPFSNIDLAYPLRQYQYNMKGKSWSLTRVSSSGLTTTTPVTTTTSSEVATIKISGTAYVRKQGTDQWEKYDGTSLRPGDEIKIENNSMAELEIPDGHKITIGPNSVVTIMEWLPDGYSLKLWLGRLIAFQAWATKFKRKCEIRTQNCIIAPRGTEFTVDVDAEGTTTVKVLEGAVSVQDLTSNEGILLILGQSVTIPKTPSGLTQEDMLGMVKYVQPDSVDRWWEKDAESTGEQTAEQGTVSQDGSLDVGKFEILSSGSRFTPGGFLFAFAAIAAIFFLIMGQVFAFRLRRIRRGAKGKI